MARLIDAKVLEKQVKATFKDSNPVLMGWMLRWVRKQPTIDAVPVVRCKDCKKEWCYLRQELGPEGFCSAGESNSN